MRLNEALRQVSYIVCSPALYTVYTLLLTLSEFSTSFFRRVRVRVRVRDRFKVSTKN